MIKKFIIITSLPEIFQSIFSCDIVGKSLKNKIWELEIINLYDFGTGIHNKIDDTVFGGGSGMVIMAEVVEKAINFVKANNSNAKFYYMSPRGKTFNQEMAENFSIMEETICLICGRFEGIDQRVIEFYQIDEISVGDFVLSNGELATTIVIDSSVRLISGVMGNDESKLEESFNLSNHSPNIRLLECDKYTKPKIWNGLEVPEVLLSGNHKKINEWKQENSLKVTKERRKDLLKELPED